MIIPLPFPSHEAAEIEPEQLDLTFLLSEMRFPHLPSTNPVGNSLISKVSQQSHCFGIPDPAYLRD